ncbi:MAG: SDR family NAD(P)-dependent oxidoreductase [Synechococcaceae cyanobacterium]
MAFLGADSAAKAEAMLLAIQRQGLAWREAAAMDAEVVVCLHGLGAEVALPAFADLGPLAARSRPPRMLVGVAWDTVEGAALAGLIKTAGLEWGSAWTCITLRAGTQPELALATELSQGGGGREVRLGTIRELRSRVSAPLAAPPEGLRALSGGPWLISGGGRGVTACCAIALARSGARQILLLGRSPLAEEPEQLQGFADGPALKRALILAAEGKPDLRAIGQTVASLLAQREIRATMATIANSGVEVRYLQADVCNPEEVAAAVAQARTEWGPIRGLIHGAGVLADKRLGEKTNEQFMAVLNPKLEGALALLAACRSDPLEQICFFSSVAAHSGNIGQADYAAANSCLDQLALEEQARRGSAAHVVSIAWGPWAGGMVSDSLAAHFQSRGIDLIPQEQGAQAMVDELTGGSASQVILGCGLLPAEEAPLERWSVDVARLPLLEGHRIERQVVLPMTMALDKLIGAGRLRLGADCELQNLSLRKGVVLDQGHASLQLGVEPSPRGDGLRAFLLHPSGQIAYEATLLPPDAATSPTFHAAPRTGEPLSDLCLHPYPAALFHGPSFQVIREVYLCQAEGIGGRIATAAAMGWPGGWQLDPAALDGALQLLRLWGVECHGRVSLPTAIGRCRPWAPWPDRETVDCHLRARRDNAFRISADAHFLDGSSQRPLLSLEGIVMHLQAQQGTRA